MYNYAISSYDGTTRVYKPSKRSDKCASINPRSRNVHNDQFIETECKKFSTFLSETDIQKNHFNIIKSNMESAEFELVSDIEANNLFDYFDVYTGNMDCWTNDIRKTESFDDQIEYMYSKLRTKRWVLLTDMKEVLQKLEVNHGV